MHKKVVQATYYDQGIIYRLINKLSCMSKVIASMLSLVSLTRPLIILLEITP